MAVDPSDFSSGVSVKNSRAVALGAILVALSAFFGLLNGIPWASKEDFKDFKSEMKSDIKEIKQDIKLLIDAYRSR